MSMKIYNSHVIMNQSIINDFRNIDGTGEAMQDLFQYTTFVTITSETLIYDKYSINSKMFLKHMYNQITQCQKVIYIIKKGLKNFVISQKSQQRFLFSLCLLLRLRANVKQYFLHINNGIYHI